MERSCEQRQLSSRYNGDDGTTTVREPIALHPLTLALAPAAAEARFWREAGMQALVSRDRWALLITAGAGVIHAARRRAPPRGLGLRRDARRLERHAAWMVHGVAVRLPWLPPVSAAAMLHPSAAAAAI